MSAAVEAVEVFELRDPGKIPDAAVDDQSGLRLARDGRAEVVADERAVLDLAEEVYHQHVTLPQGVDDPGVLPA